MNGMSDGALRLVPPAPAFSQSLADALTPGAVVEADAEAAEALGAFEETALPEGVAWEANADLSAD